MDREPSALRALAAAIKAYGSQSEMARKLALRDEFSTIRQSTISKWLNEAKRVPAEPVLAVEADTGVSRHDLRPDIYPRDLAPSAEVIAAHRPPVACARHPEMQTAPHA